MHARVHKTEGELTGMLKDDVAQTSGPQQSLPGLGASYRGSSTLASNIAGTCTMQLPRLHWVEDISHT